MRRISAPAGRTEPAAFAIAAILAAQLFLFNPHPAQLFSEHVELVRKGVMVDETVCESAGIQTAWQKMRTGYFDLYIEQGVDLNTIERNLRKRLFIVRQTSNRGPGWEGDIAERLDAICDRAMEVLDMRPNMARRSIKIFKNREDLKTVYLTLTGRTGSVKAFYAQDCGVIYTSEYDVTDSVIAHEMAHAIVDSHYGGIPPPEVGEMLASYVDMHLAD